MTKTKKTKTRVRQRKLNRMANNRPTKTAKTGKHEDPSYGQKLAAAMRRNSLAKKEAHEMAVLQGVISETTNS